MSRMRHVDPRLILSMTIVSCLAVRDVRCDDASPQSITIEDKVPFGRKPIDYFSQETNDAVARLNNRLRSGSVRLEHEAPHGFLLAVLRELNVPRASQLLVYSKTARAPQLVTPATPRAIFFNDEVSVAWIPNAEELELTAIDPLKGVNCYTLSQGRDLSSNTTPPPIQFTRRDRCLACHSGRSSLEVPGLLLRAFQTDRTGKPIAGFSRVTHALLYKRRFGGWFVTGTPKGFAHRGNLISRSENERHRTEPEFRSSLMKLDELLDIARYPEPTSDLVAHLVFAHQNHGLNLIIRVGFEARLGRRSDAEARLIRYLVFADEPALPVPIQRNSSSFVRVFEKTARRDVEGRSLRSLDLKTRLLKYRLSWLVEHSAFQGLPPDCRSRLLTRIHAGLTDPEADDDFAHLDARERSAIRSIVRETIRDLPECWADDREQAASSR